MANILKFASDTVPSEKKNGSSFLRFAYQESVLKFEGLNTVPGLAYTDTGIFDRN